MQTAKPNSPSTSGLDWVLPRWAGIVSNALQFVVMAIGWMIASVGCFAAASSWGSPLNALGIVPLIAFWFLALAIHEFGHLIGARIGGMVVYSAQVGPVQLLAELRGWRVRWRRSLPHVHGLLMAFQNPHEPLLRQTVVMIASGPLANIAVALVAGVVAIGLMPTELGMLLAGFAGLNFALGICNLIPTQGSMESDGLQLLRWMRGIDEDAPELVLSRLNGLAVTGVTADQLPADQLAVLGQQPSPANLVHLWFVVKGHQNRGEWAQVAALESELSTRVAEVPAAMAKVLADFVAILRCEIRFSRVMSGCQLDHPIDHELSSEIDWLNPSLRPRCHALMAVREGNAEVALQHLTQAERLASRSIDRAHHLSEAKIRRAILAELG